MQQMPGNPNQVPEAGNPNQISPKKYDFVAQQSTVSLPCYATILPVPKFDSDNGIKFIYNFFEQTERVDDSHAFRPGGRYSRLVRLSFSVNWNGSIIDNTASPSYSIVTTNKDNIINNEANSAFVSIALQDLNIVNVIKSKISGSLSDFKKKYSEKALISTSTSANILDAVLGKSSSPPTADTTPPFDSDIMDQINASQFSGFSYIKNGKLLNQNKFDFSGNDPFLTRFNKLDLNSIVSNANFNVHSQFSGSLSSLLGLTSGAGSQFLFGEPYTPPEPPSTDINDYQNAVKLAGFLIDKYAINDIDDLSWIETKAIDNGSTASMTYEDTQVKYGLNYAYSIRAVFSVVIPTIDDNNQVSNKNFLFASKSSGLKLISCVENIPPPPPTDLDFHWGHEDSLLQLTWNMPMNPQQDIKGFMLMKRYSLEEPFQLVKFYDFNDAIPRYLLPDFLTNSGLVEIIKSQLIKDEAKKIVSISIPRLHFFDRDFKKKDKAIYALMSYDAHNFQSNLSAQFEISFDIFKNKLVKKLISRFGAPVSYPNLFVEKDLFVDTLFVENYSKMILSTDPACRTVSIDDNNNTKQIGKCYENYHIISDTGKYVITMLNVNNSIFKKVNIKINS